MTEVAQLSVLEKIITILTDRGVPFERIDHDPVTTSEEAAKVRGTCLSMGAKALVLYADKRPILVVVPGDKKLDMKKFKQLFGVRDLRMATSEEVLVLTGLRVGSIPPLGSVLDLPVYFDAGFRQRADVGDKIAYNAGSHSVSIIMKSVDLLTIESPIAVAPFSVG